MERSIDNYLHKKFKKQLSIEPKAQTHHQQNDKENKNSARILEPSEEKTPPTDHRSTSPIKDNNKSSVPNQSTNNQNHHSLMPVVSALELSKSSISCESGNSKPCISNIASQEEEIRCRSVSFDTTFRPNETTKISSSSSSSLYYPYYNLTHSTDRDLTPPLPSQEDSLLKEEYEMTIKSDQYKNEETQSTPEKNPSGKYVCNYCNLVCSKPSVLQKHIRAHTNERPYPCTSCGFSFKTRSNLYKHCRSRTHANRVMGVKAQENSGEIDAKQNYTDNATQTLNYATSDEPFESSSKNKPYKPRFHTVQQFDPIPMEDDRSFSGTDLSHHINEIISKNHSIVNSSDPNMLKRRFSEALVDSVNNNEYIQRFNRSEVLLSPTYNTEPKSDEPLNLTNKNRKRCMSEATEPVMQKSLIKELLLKNLYSDMQCLHCKMIFQTVTELELHKLRSCKGKPSEAKYTRSSSVNVASILTKNKNAFDSMPQFHNAMFPLNSPGPFLGKTRLVDSDKGKSFSFDAVNLPTASPSETSPSYALSPLSFKEEKKAQIKLFGGEVKIHNSSGESKSYIIDSSKDDRPQTESSFADFDGKMNENRMVKSSLQSGGSVLTNKSTKEEPRVFRDVIRVYENTSVSPNIDMVNLGNPHFNYEPRLEEDYHMILEPAPTSRTSLRVPIINSNTELLSPSQRYTNITDFSQNAVKLLTPNLKHPTVHISGMSSHNNLVYTRNISDATVSTTSLLASPKIKRDLEAKVSISNISLDSENEARSPFQAVKRSVIQKHVDISLDNKVFNPMNLFVNGKVIRYVPGMPGPVAAVEPLDAIYGGNIVAVGSASREPSLPMQPPIALMKVPIIEKNIPPPRVSPVVHKSISPMPYQSISKQENPEPKPIIMEAKMAEPIYEPIYPIKSLEQQKSPEKLKELKTPSTDTLSEPKRFVRPNSLALKPTTASLKQHHGLTPTLFNQILISPDTPRVAKKYAQHLFNGNYFSYLGLKSSTKPVYCTLNKTQPFYVPHFKKLSMYSEWRQQDTKVDKLYVSSYDSRQRNQRYTTAGRTVADLIIHSSYKFAVSEVPSKCEKGDENQKSSLIGGYECNEDSPYIRGRGRGKYVCEQCGIRCKKPSMLKKHIRTHSNDRPYSCNHCNFSFKTKGNLTKHMKSKSHTKNYTATSSGSGSSTRLSVSQSSDSDTDDSGMDSSDESMTRQQEHEAAYGLLSLSQKTSASSTELLSPSGIIRTGSPASSTDQFMTTEEIAYVSKTNYAKNKILDNLKYKPNKQITEHISSSPNEETSKERESLSAYLGKTSTSRPLTYPYTSILSGPERLQSPLIEEQEPKIVPVKEITDHAPSEPKSIKQFHVIKKYAKSSLEQEQQANDYQDKVNRINTVNNSVTYLPSPLPTLKVNDVVVQDSPVILDRKRKIIIENNFKQKVHRNDEVMDLSIASSEKKDSTNAPRLTIDRNYTYEQHRNNDEMYPDVRTCEYRMSPEYTTINEDKASIEADLDSRNLVINRNLSKQSGPVLVLNVVSPENNCSNQDVEMHSNSSSDTRQVEYDNSAMETLADVATKQVKLDKNTLAKSVASEYLKLATQNENVDCVRESTNSFIPNKDVMNDLIAKSEGNKSCTICSKSFNKPFQLRLHMNIHYLERPFRCDPCSVSFRTKGHLQKHERSASHYSKLSSSPTQSSSEPRPFKCSDCNIAFRIHGHLAKHLRSKMHIMKLECLAKIPFGLYAELERSNSLLTEINTSDGDQCLESLKTLAKKVFINEPGKLHTSINEVEPGLHIDPDS